ncbi:hypothetical protein BaRGS_00001706, partial [Batillaria attramentaria]
QVKDVVIAKINWPEKLEGVQRQLEAEKVKGQQLQAEKRRAEAELAALHDTHQEEKTRERERVETFYIGIQQKKTSLLKHVLERIGEKDVLSNLVQQLCEFDVRLLAIDSGLRFLMDVSVEEWKGVKELQEKLKKVLEDALLPKQQKKEVTWTEVTTCSTQTGDADTPGEPNASGNEHQLTVTEGTTGSAEDTMSQKQQGKEMRSSSTQTEDADVGISQPLPVSDILNEADACGNEHQQTVTEGTTGRAKDTMLQKHQGKEVTSMEVTSCSTEVGGAELDQALPTHVSP